MYRTIDVKMWTDPKFKRLDPTGKLVFTYLVTNPHSHVSGIYYLPKALAAHETGVDVTLLDTVYDTLSSAGFASFDTENEVVWVRNMFRHQGRGSKNEQSARNQLATLHNSFLCHDFCKYYPAVAEGVDLPPLDTVSDTVSKGHPPGTGTGEGSGAEEGTGTGEEEAPSADGIAPAASKPPKTKSPYTADFEEWWTHYPKKTGKLAASKAWLLAVQGLALRPDYHDRAVARDKAKEVLLDAVQAFAASVWGKSGHFVPKPADWLGNGHYDDDRTEWDRKGKDNGKPTHRPGRVGANLCTDEFDA